MKESSNFKKLLEQVLSNSTSDTWEEAKLEWKCVGVKEGDGNECLCGHFIINEYFIQNKKSNKTLVVGSSCVKKFNVKEMTDYVKQEEKRKKQLKKQQQEYDNLKYRQAKNKIPLSIKQNYINKRLHLLNQTEYDFYMQIYYKDTLTYKQIKFKESINRKLLSDR
jgi:hypothetical protein